MKATVLKTPNARFLYSKCLPKAADWENQLALVDQFLEKESKFQISSSYIYLYFFCSSINEGFNDLESWVGREVVGLPNGLDKDGPLAIYDLERGECLSFDGDQKIFGFPEIWSEESKFREMLALEHSLAETWRLRLSNEGNGVKLAFQFFAV